MTKLTYIVFAPSYSDSSGGAIFLHVLAQELKDLGERVLLEPRWPPGPRNPRWYVRRWVRRIRFRRMAGSDVELAGRSDLANPGTVVIYPEAVIGNPVGAKNVVRWLLYRPGVEAPFEFSEGELFFKAGAMSDLPEVTGGAEDLFVWKLNPIYRNEERPDRHGVCYIVRKGHEKERIAETEDPSAIQIDGMSHAEANEVFNRCKMFVSYDEATMFSQFAAICGCDSVVVPGMYKTRQEWTASHELGRLGVAYGMDDLLHSQSTKHKVLQLLKDKEQSGRDTVKNFVAITRARFGGHD